MGKMNVLMIWCLRGVGSMVFPLVLMRFKQKSRSHSMLIIRQLNHWYGIISCHIHTVYCYDWTYLFYTLFITFRLMYIICEELH